MCTISIASISTGESFTVKQAFTGNVMILMQRANVNKNHKPLY
jgi:hypothetical protein